MNLYILRHAIAAPHGSAGNDHDRPLTPEGIRKMRSIAKAMREELGLAFDLILSSPFLRAKQTAEIVAKEFNAKRALKYSDHLTPNGSAKELIHTLRSQHASAENVVLVGHEPYLSQLISTLAGGTPDFAVNLKKAGLAKLTVESLRHGRCAQLDWLLTPRLMLRESESD
jgi:phosphohistidine phosphatase